MPMSRPVVIQKCTHGNMADKELICVGVATLHRSKDCKHSNRCHTAVFEYRIVKTLLLLFFQLLTYH